MVLPKAVPRPAGLPLRQAVDGCDWYRDNTEHQGFGDVPAPLTTPDNSTVLTASRDRKGAGAIARSLPLAASPTLAHHQYPGPLKAPARLVLSAAAA